MRSLAVKKYRDDEGLFTAEGTKCVRDTYGAFKCRWLICTRAWHDRLATAVMHPNIVLANNQQMARMSQFSKPSDVIAVYEMPHREINPQAVRDNLSIVLDNVQDPGNLGTIMRIADWYGIDDIVCSVDTVDAWNPKVVQATMGSIARVRVTYTPLPEFLRQSPLPVCGTLLDGENIYAQQLPQQAIIVMGNEGNGISPEVRPLITRKLLIPQLRPGAESLNVAIATAITCSEFLRKTALNI